MCHQCVQYPPHVCAVTAVPLQLQSMLVLHQVHQTCSGEFVCHHCCHGKIYNIFDCRAGSYWCKLIRFNEFNTYFQVLIQTRHCNIRVNKVTLNYHHQTHHQSPVLSLLVRLWIGLHCLQQFHLCHQSSTNPSRQQ